MMHCAPEATLKPIRFQFVLTTVICKVFAVQMCWEGVLSTWSGSSCRWLYWL